MAPLGSLKGRVEEIRGDLMRLTPGQLAEHRVIRELMTTLPSVDAISVDVAVPKRTSAWRKPVRRRSLDS
jgi:hypothetical protein